MTEIQKLLVRFQKNARKDPLWELSVYSSSESRTFRIRVTYSGNPDTGHNRILSLADVAASQIPEAFWFDGNYRTMVVSDMKAGVCVRDRVGACHCGQGLCMVDETLDA